MLKPIMSLVARYRYCRCLRSLFSTIFWHIEFHSPGHYLYECNHREYQQNLDIKSSAKGKLKSILLLLHWYHYCKLIVYTFVQLSNGSPMDGIQAKTSAASPSKSSSFQHHQQDDVTIHDEDGKKPQIKRKPKQPQPPKIGSGNSSLVQGSSKSGQSDINVAKK